MAAGGSVPGTPGRPAAIYGKKNSSVKALEKASVLRDRSEVGPILKLLLELPGVVGVARRAANLWMLSGRRGRGPPSRLSSGGGSPALETEAGWERTGHCKRLCRKCWPRWSLFRSRWGNRSEI